MHMVYVLASVGRMKMRGKTFRSFEILLQDVQDGFAVSLRSSQLKGNTVMSKGPLVCKCSRQVPYLS